jgi:hypothetical protein
VYPNASGAIRQCRRISSLGVGTAATARLIRITQGKRLLTLRKWSLALDHHAGIIAGKSSKSRKRPSLWNISLRKSIHD